MCCKYVRYLNKTSAIVSIVIHMLDELNTNFLVLQSVELACLLVLFILLLTCIGSSVAQLDGEKHPQIKILE